MFNNKPAGNIFSNNNQQGQANMFSNTTQSNNNIFAQNQQNSANRGSTGLFNQGQGNQQSNNMSNNQGTTNNIFANNQGKTGLFANTQGGSTNLFGATQGGTGLFSQNNQGNNNFYGQTGMTGGGYGSGGPTQFSQVNEAQLQHLCSAPTDQQKRLFEAFSADYIKQLIFHYKKALDSSKVERLQLGLENPLRGQKITKIANSLNIKPQILQLKRLIRNNVTNKVKQLKDYREKLQNLSLDFSVKVFQKLQKYKEKLVVSVTQNKMVEEIKNEVEQLDQQIKQFFKPLFNAHQNKTNYSFVDPDPFCLKISQRLLKNLTVLDNRMDEFLACQAEPTEESIYTGDVIEQLVEYYQNVALTLKEFSDKYNKLKRVLVHKSMQANPEDILRKLSQKANSIVNKEMENYELVKEIEFLLKKRDGKMVDNKTV